MTYTTIGLAKAILCIKRGLEQEGIELTLDNCQALLRCNLPPDVSDTQFHQGLVAAGNLAQAERIRRGERR